MKTNTFQIEYDFLAPGSQDATPVKWTRCPGGDFVQTPPGTLVMKMRLRNPGIAAVRLKRTFIDSKELEPVEVTVHADRDTIVTQVAEHGGSSIRVEWTIAGDNLRFETVNWLVL